MNIVMARFQRANQCVSGHEDTFCVKVAWRGELNNPCDRQFEVEHWMVVHLRGTGTLASTISSLG